MASAKPTAKAIALMGLLAFALAFPLCTGDIPTFSAALGGDQIGDIPRFVKQFSHHSVYKNIADNEALSRKMAKVAGCKPGVWHNACPQVKRDKFAMIKAIIDGDESTIMKLTGKYHPDVDFLPAYFITGIGKDKRGQIIAFAQSQGNDMAVKRLLKAKTDSDGWPYRDDMLARIKRDEEEGDENRLKMANAVWATCPVGKHPDLFTTVPETGPIMTSYLEDKLESPASAGRLRPIRDRDGEPFVDDFGQVCYMRDAYATDLEEANRRVYDKLGGQFDFRYCYRSAYMQAVVRAVIKKGRAECTPKETNGVIKWALKHTDFTGDAAPPGRSGHNYGVHVDINWPSPTEALKALPYCWETPIPSDGQHYQCNPKKGKG